MSFPNIDLGDGNIYSLPPYYIWAARVPQTDVTVTLTCEEAGRLQQILMDKKYDLINEGREVSHKVIIDACSSILTKLEEEY